MRQPGDIYARWAALRSVGEMGRIYNGREQPRRQPSAYNDQRIIDVILVPFIAC